MSLYYSGVIFQAVASYNDASQDRSLETTDENLIRDFIVTHTNAGANVQTYRKFWEERKIADGWYRAGYLKKE